VQRDLNRAFTLIEILVVVAIIAVLAAFLFPAVTGMMERGKITQDLNNLRQIGLATQIYLNDHDSVFFSPTINWMKELHPKTLPSWKIFQSPFDKRPPSEIDAEAPVSYGFNANAHGTAATDPLSSDRIANPTAFILFAPAQPFERQGSDASVTVTKDSAGTGGATRGGTHNRGQRINTCMADLHVENMKWSDFHDDSSDTTAQQRWNPAPP
jgi:prepilin-type N-terminal cleavage/methylation domain-containing protein